MRIKPRGKIYSINEGYEAQWDEAVTEYVKSKKHPQVRNIHSKISQLCLYIF